MSSLLLGAFLVSAQIADTRSTFDVGDWCEARGIPTRAGACAERNPLTRWAINAGPEIAYPAALAFDAGIMALAAKWKREGKRFWWLLPAALGTVHTVAALRNWHRLR